MSDFQLFADWHTHTTYSDGKGTIAANAAFARERKLDEIAITDHGPNNPGIGIKQAELTLAMMQEEIKMWNKVEETPRVLLGVEANLISRNGDLDLPDAVLKKLDVVIASLHPFVKPGNVWDGASVFFPNFLQRWTKLRSRKLRNINTKAMVEAVNRHPVTFVGHPGLWIDIDTRELADACAKNDVALEINCSHAYEQEAFVKTAIPSGVDFVINTDAHRPEDVGRLQPGIDLVKKLQLPPERIKNARVEE